MAGVGYLRSITHFSTGAEWSIVVLGFAKYSQESNETQISCTLKNIKECSTHGEFKIVVYVICCCSGRLQPMGICGLSCF